MQQPLQIPLDSLSGIKIEGLATEVTFILADGTEMVVEASFNQEVEITREGDSLVIPLPEEKPVLETPVLPGPSQLQLIAERFGHRYDDPLYVAAVDKYWFDQGR